MRGGRTIPGPTQQRSGDGPAERGSSPYDAPVFAARAESHRRAGLPADARIRDVRWSPDSRRFAFTLSEENGISLWAAAVESAQAKRLTKPVLNAAYGSAYSWVSDSETLICRFGFLHESGSPAERAARGDSALM